MVDEVPRERQVVCVQPSDVCSSEAGEGRFSEPDPVHTTRSQHAHDPPVTRLPRREARPTCHQVCGPRKGTIPKHFFKHPGDRQPSYRTRHVHVAAGAELVLTVLKVHVRARAPLSLGLLGRGFSCSFLSVPGIHFSATRQMVSKCWPKENTKVVLLIKPFP